MNLYRIVLARSKQAQVRQVNAETWTPFSEMETLSVGGNRHAVMNSAQIRNSNRRTR